MSDIQVEILLVEDNPNDAELAIRALRKANIGNNLIHVEDGAEAIDFIYGQGKYAARNLANVPKVILLDLKLPKVGGIEVLERIKSDANTKMIPVVVLTSSAEDPDIKRCYELGANSYIVKPVQFDNFAKTIANLGLYWVVVNKV